MENYPCAYQKYLNTPKKTSPEKQREIIGKEVLTGWQYLQNHQDFNISEIAKEISQVIQQVYNAGAFILPKTEAQIKEAIAENRLVAILARDQQGQLRVLACTMYIHLGKLNDQLVLEVGGLVKNPELTTSKVNKNKELVFPINDSGSQTLGTQVLEAVLAQIKKSQPNSLIIATTRSLKSQNALFKAGFVQTTWSDQFKDLSCDPGCRGVDDHKNCSLANLDFSKESSQSGCKLMIYRAK